MPHLPAVLDDLEAIQVMHRYYDWKVALVRPALGARILDVGCGTGLVLERLPADAAVTGVDCDERCVERARARLAGRPRCELRRLDITDPAAPLPAAAFDTVLFVSSLEEIDDPAAAFARARAALAPGGRVAVFVSALPGLTGELDRAFGMRRYRPRELRALLAGAGFAVTRLRYVNLLGALAWWWDSRIVRRHAVPAANYRRRDRLVPLARLLDALTGPPVGRSLLAVGRAQ